MTTIVFIFTSIDIKLIKMSANKEIIESIRNNFLRIAEKNVDKFHASDVERVKNNDWTVQRFILTNKTEEVALKALVKAMEWRKEFGVNDLTDDYFPEELYKLGFYSTHFKDKEGRPILWIRPGVMFKSDLTPLVKKYAAHTVEKLDRETTHQGWAAIVDSNGMGLSNLDMDFQNFITELLQDYFPCGIKYNAIIDLPWILNAVAKIIIPFMNEEQLLKSGLKFIKRNELNQFLDQEYIPVHLGGKYDKDLAVIPDGVKPLEQLTHIKFSAEQIKKIRSTLKLK